MDTIPMHVDTSEILYLLEDNTFLSRKQSGQTPVDETSPIIILIWGHGSGPLPRQHHSDEDISNTLFLQRNHQS